MPVHDWSRVRAGKFHHFHNSWIYKLSDALNADRLPPGLYAAGEQIVGEIEPDVLTFHSAELPPPTWNESAVLLAVATHPPRTKSVVAAEESIYLAKQDRLTIRSADDDRLVAMIEIVSAGNKSSRHEMERFLRKTANVLSQGIHLLVIDLHRPGTWDPAGIHSAIWDFLYGTVLPADPAGSLTLASYRAVPTTAYVEPLAIGDALPDMPLFLDSDWYVSVPLEATYRQAWQGMPEPWRAELS